MKTIDKKLMADLIEQAKASPRKRAHYNLHPNLDENIHRLCIAVEPGSYIRPHRHLDPKKWELLVILKGKLDVLIFNDNKEVSERYHLDAKGDVRSMEIDAGAWHTFVSMEEGTVVMEIKQGPYSYPPEKDSCQWAPREGEKGVTEFEIWYRKARVGDKAPQISTKSQASMFK